MEHDEIIRCFIKVVNDSFVEANKINHNSTGFILNQIDKEARAIIIENENTPIAFTETMSKLIDIIRVKKPGYVNQDILNILILGFGEQLTNDGERLFHIDTLRKWFFEYGIRKDKDTGWTVRNKWLKDTYNYLKWEQEKRFYSQSNEGIPLEKLMSVPDAEQKFKYLWKFVNDDFEKEILKSENIESPVPELDASPEVESVAEPVDDLPF